MKSFYRLVLLTALFAPLVACAPSPNVAPAATAPAVVVVSTPSLGRIAPFRKLPYLIFTGNNTSMTVMWQTDKTPATAQIEWGDTEAYQGGQTSVSELGSAADDHRFAYTISGLTPGTRTYYRVSVDGETHAGSFMSAPANDAQSLTFYAYGDTRTDSSTHNAVLATMLKDIAKDPTVRQTFLLHAGDYVTYGLSEQSWESEYFNPDYSSIASVLASMPVIGTLGNHEEYPDGKYGPDCAHAGELFRKYFPYPMYVVPEHFYYSFDYGPAHVAVIDPYTADYTKNTGEESQWLKKDLAQPRPFKTVLFHPPAWSVTGSNFALRQNFYELFNAGGVNLVLQGHQHYYGRLMVDGIPYLVIGGGGAPLFPTSPSFPDPYGGDQNLLFDSCVRVPFTTDANIPAVTVVDPHQATSQNHFARIEIAPGKMTVTVINVEGKVIDCFPDNATCTP